LKKRGSSVFPAPSRDAVYARSYEEANEINFRLLRKKISKQTWNIAMKIREVDELLDGVKNTNGKIRESHPEICFWALAGGKPMDFPKKSNQGIEERLQLLQNHCQLSEKIFSEAKQKYPRKDLATDDILDALALAITASSPSEALVTIPAIPERDERNIPMEIVFTNLYINGKL
jgi:predicted RNase H-like nuclease